MISNKANLFSCRHPPSLSPPPSSPSTEMDRSSSETLSSNSSFSSRPKRPTHSKKRSSRANVFPYAPQSVPDVSLSLSLSLTSPS